MHGYQTDREVRTRVFLLCAFVAIGTARLFTLLLQQIPGGLPWWIETPSVLGFFSVSVWLFDNYLWRTRWLQKIEWLCTPNLNGKWEVEIASSYGGFENKVTACAIIRQTASKISISLATSTSRSHSVNASLLRVDQFSPFELIYQYMNEPTADAHSAMNPHTGTVWMRVTNECNLLEGEYYSGRGRQTFGKILLKNRKI